MMYLDVIKQYCRERCIPIYLVGGAVRDLLINRDLQDYDFASSCYREVAEYFSERIEGKLIKLHDDVYRVVVDGLVFDFSNFKGDNIEEDLKNRDFTINAIAYDLVKEEYIDVLGGIQDIKKE
ncbi:hypothetical protein PL321_06000 [Caloramator sp. mosi_1]|uniref:hypothetical protein n=1 Tax=Caloramator sp. mosi_1 TaxID=3023090 RepID=UPI00235EB9C5|nr:hypothetical protein [Caloramator sp. mosi_1]WDC85068.1 hypothetical protein PL321_06000 [Caloramator sp. mosi_1]